MDREKSYAGMIRDDYGDAIKKLSLYIPYFERMSGQEAASEYDGSYGKSSLKFPVFDPELIRFADEASKTALMDKNYLYAYSRAHITTAEGEQQAIENAQADDIDLLRGILSRYVLEGRYKSTRWVEGVERKVFLNVLLKLKGLLEFSTVR